VLGVLECRAYLDGTRYYETAECFLYFCARLLHRVRDEALHARLAQLLRERVLERVGCTGDALALAMRVIAGSAVGLRLERDLAELLPLQYEDGGWGPSWIYKYGSSGIKIGNRGLTTALALNAIAALSASQSQPQTQPKQQQQQQQQEQKQEQKQEEKSEMELVKEEKKKLPARESICAVEITPLPTRQSPVSSVTPPSSPLPQTRSRTRKVALSMPAFAKGFFASFFFRRGSPLPRQA